jgi:ABC-type dipeptide/oligopeptide/nickel transport system permease subunit
VNIPPVLRTFLRNRGAVIGTILLLAWVGAALFAPFIAPYDPVDPSGSSRQSPDAEHLMGTDLLGRDVFSRILHGARISLAIGLISISIGLSLGMLLGLPAGYYGGWADSLIMRLVDTMLALPGLLLALVVIVSLGTGLTNVMVAVGISSIPLYARLVRGSTLALRDIEYVQAAKLIGNQDLRIMALHILPNLIGPVIVLSTLQVGSAILVGSALSYLGMGAQPPTPEWGLMTADGRAYLVRAWWMTTFPGLAIFSTVIAFNLAGDGLRGALDPRTREK